MNEAEIFGTFGVRERARRYEKSASRPRHDSDEGADAVPIRRRRQQTAAEEPAETVHHRASAANPYRVRDRMAQESARRAASAAADPSRRTSSDTAKRPPPQSRGQPRTGPRVTADPDSRRNTDAIFRGDAAGDARRIAEYRQAVRKKYMQRLRVGLSAMLIVCLFAVAAFAVVYKMFYTISDVSVTGTSLYSDEEILAASGISFGDNLYSFSSRVAEENVTLRCPYVQTLSVDRTAPSFVAFTVSEDTAVFYAELYGEMRALSAGLRVLDAVDAETAAERGLIRLRLPAVDTAVAGRILSFENERGTRALREVLAELLASPLRSRITTVDFRSPHALKMVCDARYILDFGDTQEVDIKLKIAEAVLRDRLFQSGVRAKIDLTSTGATSVILDNQLDPDA